MKIFDFQQVIHHILSAYPNAAVIVAFTVPEIKKIKNFIKQEFISYTMTLDCKKKLKCNKMSDLKKNQNLLKNPDGFWPDKIIFFIQSYSWRVIVWKKKTQYAKKSPKSIRLFLIELQLQQIKKNLVLRKTRLRGEIPLEPLKKAVFSILFWENENEASPDFLHILEGII